MAALALIAAILVPTQAAHAADGASTRNVGTDIVKTTLVGFKPGNLMSDAVFTNKNTMTEAQIQAFFKSKVSRCLGGTDENGRAIVCLPDFKITTQNRPADAYCNGYQGAANESAARVIYKVAQSCGINPQVLIVMLQKEQGLVTHTWPSAWRYDIALGQSCPDNAPCDPAFIGFFQQIYGAGRQMNLYMEGRYFTWYPVGKVSQVRYHPNVSCGTSPVLIENKATAALYYYTPYQPTASALAAGYGAANDPCASYGNRNFYNYFTDWFGSTQGGSTAPPKLTSTNSTNFVTGVDTSGVLWGYPYDKATWGDRVKLGEGHKDAKAFFGIGDVDGDGHRDFILHPKSGAPMLLRGNGNTTLSEAKTLPGSWSGVTQILPAGDFNGDGIQDLFTLNSAGDLFLRTGTGYGSFNAAKKVGHGWAGMTALIGGGDYNGDGRPDMVARAKDGKLWLYPGTGTGTWRARIQMGHGWQSLTSFFSPGDFNGDGRPDMLGHKSDGKLTFYRGLASGKLSTVGQVGTGWQQLTVKGSAGAKLGAARPLPGGAGDLNAKAGNDIFAISSNGDARIYPGNGKGKFSAAETVGTGWGTKDKIVPLGDFNRDGRPDVGRIDSSGNFMFYAGKSGGGFASPVQIGQGWGGFKAVIGGFDFDGDRFTDVLAVAADGKLMLYPGNGAGQFAAGGRGQVGHNWHKVSDISYAGDFDGDGRGDLIAVASDGKLKLYPMTGSGTFAAAKDIGVKWNAFSHVLSPGDFNGDGHSDVLAVAKDGKMYLYPGRGNGKFSPRVQIGHGWGNIVAVV